jgi:hypothetical protein
MLEGLLVNLTEAILNRQLRHEYVLLERTGLNTATSLSWGNAVQTSWESVGAVVGFIDTVSAHRICGAIKDWRVDGV